MRREDAARLLVPDERIELRRHPGQQRVGQPVGGQPDADGGDRLCVGAVDDPALVHTEGSDAVAGAEEREVARHDAVQQRRQLALHPVLDGRLLPRRVTGVERPTADEDARVVVEPEGRQWSGLHPDPPQPPRRQPGEPQECLVLAVGGDVLTTGGEQEEGPHGRDPRSGAGGPARR
jgi:hypothetical protein